MGMEMALHYLFILRHFTRRLSLEERRAGVHNLLPRLPLLFQSSLSSDLHVIPGRLATLCYYAE